MINKTYNYSETEENMVLRELFQLVLLWKKSDRQSVIICQSDRFKKVYERLIQAESIISEKGHLINGVYAPVEITILDRVSNNKRKLYSKNRHRTNNKLHFKNSSIRFT